MDGAARIALLESELELLRRRDAERSAELAARERRIRLLEEALRILQADRYGASREKLHVAPGQTELFNEAETIAELNEVLGTEVSLKATPQREEKAGGTKPGRKAIAAHLPRVAIVHDLPKDERHCACGSPLIEIGSDISEQLDYVPPKIQVLQHVRKKYACPGCEQCVKTAPLPAQILPRTNAAPGLLAHLVTSKYVDALPLYRQEAIFGRAGLVLPRSALAAWIGVCGVRLQPLVDALKAQILDCAVVHADETPVAMLAPGTGMTHRAYLWAYASGLFEPLKAVAYDFTASRAGEHARAFLGHWQGSPVCDDYGGYKALFANGVIEAGCMAHARRKFVELHFSNQSTIAATAIDLIGQLYGIEREVKDLPPERRRSERQQRAAPIAATLHDWLIGQRTRITDGTATATAIDYSLKRWPALTRYLDDPALPIDNNHDEQQIRPWATGRKNWLFAGTLMAGQRAAAITSLIQSAKRNGHDPYAYLKDVLTRLPTHKARDIDELLPHRWLTG